MAIVTLAEVKRQLDAYEANAYHEQKLEAFRLSAERWVKNYCGRELEPGSFVEIFNGDRSKILLPGHYPVTDVSEISYSSTQDFDNPASILDTSYYTVSSDRSEIYILTGRLPYGLQNVRVTYEAYDTPEEDLKLAVLWTVEWFYLHNDRGDMGRDSISKQGESVSILTDIPPMIKSILQDYKRLHYGIGAVR